MIDGCTTARCLLDTPCGFRGGLPVRVSATLWLRRSAKARSSHTAVRIRSSTASGSITVLSTATAPANSFG